MYARTKLHGLDTLDRARVLMRDCENERELSEALADLYPCGPGGVGYAERKAKAYLLELMRDIVRTERGHISFYYGRGNC